MAELISSEGRTKKMMENTAEEHEIVAEESSNYNTVEEALRQAKHDILTGQRQVIKVVDGDKEYTPAQIKKWSEDNV